MRESNNVQSSSGNCNFEKLSAGPGFGKLVGNTQAPIYIFEYLDIKDLVSLAFANKTMYKMVFNSMYNTNNRLIRSLDLYLCYLKYIIDFKFDNSNKEYFFDIVYKAGSSDFELFVSCLRQKSIDVQAKFGVKFESNSNTGQEQSTLNDSSYFNLRTYLYRIILIEVLSLGVEDFYEANGDYRTFSSFTDVIKKILDNNQKKRIDRILNIRNKNELGNLRSFWYGIKKTRGKVVYDKLVSQRKNICKNGIYYYLIFKLTYNFFAKQSDPAKIIMLIEPDCRNLIKNCRDDLFNFLLENPDMIASICRSGLFLSCKYPDPIHLRTVTVCGLLIYNFITFLCENSQHENFLIATTEANDVRRAYRFNNHMKHISIWKDFLEPNFETQSLQLMISKLESDSESDVCNAKKQLRCSIVVAVVFTIVFLIFLVLGLVFGFEFMYVISMMLFLICFASIILIKPAYDHLKKIQVLKSNFDNNLNPKRDQLNQLNHDKIKYKKRFKQGAEFLLNSNERFLSERNNFYKPRFFEDQEYINSKQENDLLEYVAK